MGKYIDITGNKYGMLTAVKMLRKEKWNEYWECMCDCGKKVERTKATLQKGLSTSCGCEKYKRIALSNTHPNKFEVNNKVVVGVTHNNERFIFDIDDYEVVSQYTWHKTTNGYFCNKGKNGAILLHRLIMNPPTDMDVDHINHDKSDNRKSNLRIATRSQNMANREYPNKTGYRGVVELPTGKFIAQINNEYIGSYETAQQAHEAYTSEAVKNMENFCMM